MPHQDRPIAPPSAPGSRPGKAVDEVEDDERTDSVPKVSPDYADEESRDLGERLAVLYAARDASPSPQLTEEIGRIRARLRKGPHLHAGEFLQDGRYRLITKLEAGSSDAAIWQAWDRTSGDAVLVRVFHGSWVDRRSALDGFRQRGAALRRIDHPGIARVIDAERSDNGFVYLASTFVGEHSLEDLALEPLDAIQVAIELALALGHCHELGVVHGDVRPQNVLVSADGSAHLTNFAVEPKDGRAEPSLFQAPESTERGYEPRPASDVYALGMTLVAALNKGSLPFWVLRDPARLIQSLPTTAGVRGVLLRATEWDLSARPEDTTTFLRELCAESALVESLGVRARERGRYAVAAQHLETLLRLQPGRAVEIRVLLGDVYTQLAAYDQAFQHLLGALERTADVEALFDPLRVVAARTGDWARLAAALWAQARARDAGRRVVLRIELARINQEELGNPVAAAETWSQVLADHRLPSQAVTALRALQGLAKERGDWAAFVEVGRELLAYLSADERPPVEYALGRAWIEHLGDEDAGLPHIDRAEEAGWSEPDLGQRLQGIRARRGQWKRVIQLMVQQAAGQEIGEASPTLLRAGIIASSVHLEEEAFKVYHALLERAPRHVVALRHLARLHHRAHEHDRALRYYERLWETYRGKESEEPEASERAADCTAYAQILLKRGQSDAAAERIEEALRLNPSHVPSLQLAGPLFLGRGDTVRAAAAFDRLLSQFKSVELSPQKIEACLGMGDLAWVQGRLTAAMGWYNRALELDPFSVAGWWGLAKVAMSSRAGHPGADRAPWVMATPKRFTGQEALARLLAGLLDPTALRAWLELTALGRTMLAGGEVPMRLACAAVDVLARNELVGAELFQRLGDACPEWAEPIDEVQRLWFGGGAASFTVARGYAWSRHCFRRTSGASGATSDFEELAVRSVLPTELVTPALAVEALRDTNSWRTLVGGERQPPPEPFTMIERPDVVAGTPLAGPIGALVRDGSTWLVLGRERGEVLIGSDEACQLQLDDPTLRPRHARLFRLGGRIYLEALHDAPGDGGVAVDGDERRVWRLHGGERVTLGETRVQYQAYADETHVPPMERIAKLGTFDLGHPPEASSRARSAPPRASMPPASVVETPSPEPESALDDEPTVVVTPAPEADEPVTPAEIPVTVDLVPALASLAFVQPVPLSVDSLSVPPTSVLPAPPVEPARAPSFSAETTGPLDHLLPMPAADHHPDVVSGPVSMPADVLTGVTTASFMLPPPPPRHARAVAEPEEVTAPHEVPSEPEAADPEAGPAPEVAPELAPEPEPSSEPEGTPEPEVGASAATGPEVVYSFSLFDADAETDDDGLDPPSDEELIHVKAGERAAVSSASAPSDSDVDEVSEEDQAPMESGPLEAMAWAPLPDLEPDADSLMITFPVRAVAVAPPPTPPAPAPAVAPPPPPPAPAPDVRDERSDEPPVPSSVPEWLRRALEAEPTPAPVPERAPSPALPLLALGSEPPIKVAQPRAPSASELGSGGALPLAGSPSPGEPPARMSRVEDDSITQRIPGSVNDDEDEGLPAYEPDMPTVVTLAQRPAPVLPSGLPPLVPPPTASRSSAGGFGFPAEVADDDVEALQVKPRRLPSGLVGTSAVPLGERVASPAGITAPPVPSFAAPPPVAPPAAAPPVLAAAAAVLAPPAPPPAAVAAAPTRVFPAVTVLPETSPGATASEAPTVVDRPLDRPLDRPSAALEFMSGPERGRRIPVQDELTVGQSDRCGLSLPTDTRLSPVHCRVRRVGERFRLVDEGSQTGTVVNGQRVTEVDLTGNEVIMVGRTVLRFRVGET